MKTQVKNSERMNFSLKKKILSMQENVNSDDAIEPPEEPFYDKKRGWWKKWI